MLVVPVVLGCDLLGLEVGHLDALRRLERGDRLVDAAELPQDVAVHVQRVRHGRRELRVRRRTRERVARPPAVLVRVRQVVLRGEMIRRHAERLLEERHRRLDAPLSAVGGIGRLGDASQQPQLHVAGILLERRIERVPVRGERVVLARRFGGHLQRARLDVRAVVLRRPRRQGTSALDGRLRLRRRVQLRQGDAQAGVGDRERRIDPQRLVERAGRFDPDV